MKKILLSAFACDPTKGSEPGYGWSWAECLAQMGFEVHCITRETSRAAIQTQTLPANLTISYVRLPGSLEKLYSASGLSMYLYYILWQWRAYRRARELNEVSQFDVVHHITWGNLQIGTFLYKLGIPLVFGPAGGGQMAPEAFRDYFGDAWSVEDKREKISRLLLRFNPACRSMLRKSAHVLAANADTFRIAKSSGAGNVSLVPDVGVADWFFPQEKVAKVPEEGRLKLLWVGRMMPRKGLLLLLDVMNELKDFPGITLTVVGDGALRDVFLDKLHSLALEDTVHWAGAVPFQEVRDYYSDHDVLLFTSLRESGGVQIVEAMAFGMPVVTLDLHGPGLLVDEDRGIKCGCSTPQEAIEQLSGAVLDLYSSPELVERLGVGASRFAESQMWSRKIGSMVSQFYP